MTKSILYVAYHFPPIQVSSGVHRTVAFARSLVVAGWGVSVLTVCEAAYPQRSESGRRLVPEGVRVLRAFARETTRYLSFRGRYFDWMAAPDKWHSWVISGLWVGLREIRRNRPAVIVSTYPVASAHVIAYLLHRVTGIPWVADFRDPMLQDDYPPTRAQRKAFAWVERKAVRHGCRVLFTSPGALALYRDRYPEVPAGRWVLVANGFDEALFEMSAVGTGGSHEQGGRRTLLHSGTVYPQERDPRALFQALAELQAEDPALASRWRVLLRATGHDHLLAPLLQKWGIQDLVELAPGIDYVAALEEMLGADALLLLQAANCNFQTPAKAYEYIRARRPVLALTDPGGDTAALVLQAGVGEVAALDDPATIKSALRRFLSRVEAQDFVFAPVEELMCWSRQYQARAFVQMLDDVVAERAA
tara:strand:- start:38320 stop:39576 length:1257 start_codon:yes stop_codon:yes gene_type:complete